MQNQLDIILKDQAFVDVLDKRFFTRPIFRSLYEIEHNVIGDKTHPTPDAKYWQLIGEQNVHYSEIKELYFDYEIEQIEIQKLQEKLKDDGISELDKKIAEIEIQRKEHHQNNRRKSAKERLREVTNCEALIQKVLPHMKHGIDDYEKHIPERNKLRMLFEEGTTNQLDYKSYDQVDDKVFLDFFNKKNRKILIATPHRLQTDGNVSNFKILQIPATYSSTITEPYGYTVPDARNMVMHTALTEGYDYVFFVDDDVLIPQLALVELLHANKDIIGGVYHRKYAPLESVSMIANADGAPAIADNYTIGDIIPALVLSSGCTLISRKVIEAMEPPWYKSFTIAGSPALTEDTYFTGKALELGFTSYLHTGVQCLHIDNHRNLAFGHPDIINNNQLNPAYMDYFCK